MNLRMGTSSAGKIRILRRAISKGNLGALAEVLKNKTYMNETCYELRRDLDTPFRVRRAKIPLMVRELRREDIPLIFDGRDANLSHEGFLWREHRLRLIENNIQTCYVGVTEVGRPCHVQWVFQPRQNDRRREVFGNEFPEIQNDEIILEYAFTLEPYRGLNIGPWAGEKIFEIEKTKGIRRAITFVSVANIQALKMAKVGGFLPFQIRKEQWRLFHKTFSFEPLPEGPHFPFKEKGERMSERSLPSNLEGENLGDNEAARLA